MTQTERESFERMLKVKYIELDEYLVNMECNVYAILHKLDEEA